MDRLTGFQFEQLQAALLNAFDRADLTRMVRVELDESLDAIAGDTSLSATVFNLIEWSQRRGRTIDLLRGAVKQNPQNEALRNLVEVLDTAASASNSINAQDIDAQDLAAYLEAIAAQCGQVETRPYQRLSDLRGAAPTLPLLDADGESGVYVPLRFDLSLSHDGERGPLRIKGRFDDGEVLDEVLHNDLSLPDLSLSDIDLNAVLSTPGHLALIGQAGSGKTTVLRLIAAVLATGNADLAAAQLGCDEDSLPVPIYLALRDFEHACQREPERYARDVESLLRFADDHFARWRPDCVPHGFLGDLIRGGRAWICLDALDEVADFDHRIAVRRVIESLADGYPGNRLLVTARVAAYSTANTRLDHRFSVAHVRDLTREQYAPLMERLYAGLEANPGAATQRAGQLLARINGSPQLQEMVKTPVLVWTATLIHHADRKLPEQRAELYDTYVDVLLGERLHEEESPEPAQRLRDERWSFDDRRLYLTYAAFETHRRAEAEHGQDDRSASPEPDTVVVDETILVQGILAPFMADYGGLTQQDARYQASDFVSFMAERSGLLHAHPNGYSFGANLTVQEFLAAAYLVDELRMDRGKWTDFLVDHVGRSWWREVMSLAAGYLLRQPRQAKRFLEYELGDLPGEGDTRAYGLAWAGRALLELPPGRVAWHDALRGVLIQRLLRVLPHSSAIARAEVGYVLGILADSRFIDSYNLPESADINVVSVGTIEQLKLFWSSADFDAEGTSEPNELIIRTSKWSSHKRYGDLLVKAYSGDLSGEQLRDVQSRIRLTASSIELAYVVFDGEISDGAFWQIIAFREEGLNVIPLKTNTIVDILTSLGKTKIYRRLVELEKGYVGHVNPYEGRNAIKDPNWFIGRRRETSRILSSLESLQHVGIFGIRKIGKTSLLFHLRRELSRRSIPVAYLGIQDFGVADPVNIFSDIICQFRHSMQAMGVSNLPVSNTGEFPRSSAPGTIFRDDIVDLWQAARRESEIPFMVVLIDEIERLLPSHDSDVEQYLRYDTIFAPIRELAQVEQCMVSVVAGVKPDIGQEFDKSILATGNVMFELYDETHLGHFDFDTCVDMIVKIGKWIGVEYSQDSLNMIFLLTNGNPYVTKILCACIIDDTENGQIGSNDVLLAVRPALDRLHSYFDGWKKNLTSEEGQIVDSVARNRCLPRLQSRAQKDAFRYLTKSSTIFSTSDGEWQFSINLLAKWLEQNLEC